MSSGTDATVTQRSKVNQCRVLQKRLKPDNIVYASVIVRSRLTWVLCRGTCYQN